MKHVFRICFLLSLILTTGLTSFAQTSAIPEVVKVDVLGRSLHEAPAPDPRTWRTLDNSHASVFPGCSPGEYYVGFQLFYDYGDKLTANWVAQLQVTLTNGITPKMTRPMEIRLSNQSSVNQNVATTVFYDQKINCGGTNDWWYRVDSKVATGVVPPDNVILKVVLIRAHDDFSPVQTASLAATPFADRTELSWAPVPGAIEYDLEWVFVEKNEASFNSGSIDEVLLTKKGGAGVTVSETGFHHQLAYPEGQLWYRVRAVGYRDSNPNHRILGPWYPLSAPIAVSNLTVNRPSDITWQAQTVFAEDGKFKKIVTYYDATMRERQSRVNLSTNATTIVSEKMYDFEGRPSIQMLPAPIKNVDDENPLIYSEFNKFAPPATGSPILPFVDATKKKFFYDNGPLQNGTVDTEGAGKYYHSNNGFDNISPMNDYVPDANGYVFSQTEYERDGTSRVLREGGVGENFVVDGGANTHAIRHFYTQAAPRELTRLFGSNVGTATHYKKKVSVDNNQQVAVAYLDQEGRVVATALAGDPPKDDPATLLDPLASYPLTAAAVDVDISSKNVKAPSASVISHKLMNAVANTTYTISYTLAAQDAAIQGFNCTACTYDLEISVTDPDGVAVDLVPNDNNVTSYLREGIATTGDCQTTTNVQDVSFDVLLGDIGDYTITKTLTARPLTFEAMTAIVSQSPEVVTMTQQIIDAFPIDDTRCENCISAAACPEANAAIEDAIQEVASKTCEQIRSDLVTKWQETNSGEPTDAQLDAFDHSTFCTYSLCVKNEKSDAFEMQMARIPNWTAASVNGYTQAETLDPFFQTGLSGEGALGTMQGRLQNVTVNATNGPNGPVTVTFTGAIDYIVNPNTTALYVNESGAVDPNGYHILYYDLMSKKATMPTADYNAQLDEAHWAMYKSFYLDAKRYVKAHTSDYIGCPNALTTDQSIGQLPRDPDGIKQYGADNNLNTDVSATDPEVTAAIWAITNHCNITLTETDRATIANDLAAYFTNTKFTNPLHWFLKDQNGVLDAGLSDVRSLIYVNYNNCDISDLASFDPLRCSNPTYGPNLITSSWQTVAGTPTIPSGNELDLKAPACGGISDAIEGTLTTSLRSGKLYRLSFQYKNYVQGNPGDFLNYVPNIIKVQLGDGNSGYTATPASGTCDGTVQGPYDIIKAQSGLTTSVVVNQNNGSSNVSSAEILFTPLISGATKIFVTAYASNSANPGGSTAIITNLKLEPLDGVCVPIGDPLLNYTVDWGLEAQRCIDRANSERNYLITYATSRMIEEQTSKFLAAYNCLDVTAETLKYHYAPKEYHHTLYYYDQAGNLVQTVPPAGVVPNDLGSPSHTLLTTYQYNSYNQLSSQTTPDAGTSNFWYNNKSQLRMSANAQQARDTTYSYVKYDSIGRVVEAGQLASKTLAFNEVQSKVEDPFFPKQSEEQLTDVTWTVYDQEATIAGFTQKNLRNRISYTETTDQDKQPGDANNIRTYFSYDVHGNVEALLQQIPGLPDKTVSYAYDLVSNKINYVFFQFGQADQFAHKYVYDADTRIVSVSTSTDRFSWHQDALYRYYAHGPLARVELGTQTVQGLDYYYTLQGWLKGMNMPYDGDPGGDGVGQTSMVGKDVASFTLGYFSNDYTPISGNAPREYSDQLWARLNSQWQTSGLFNGNISWMVTDLAKQGDLQNDRTKGMQAMLYRYDQLNRITKSRSLPSFSATSGFAARNTGSTAHDAYDEDFSYDANGNLLTLTRMDQAGGLKDQFQYSYYDNSNKLSSIHPVNLTDLVINSGTVTSNSTIYRSITVGSSATVPSGATIELKATDAIELDPDLVIPADANFLARIVSNGGVYSYDAIGNLVKDAENGTTITWTPQGKVRQVTKDEDGTVMTFRYDPMGNRVEKKVTKDGKTTITRYLRDVSGNVMAVYKDTLATEYSIYGSSRVGQYIGGGQEGKIILGQRHYEVTNHLGNVLSVINDKVNMTSSAITAIVLSTADYYPFGSPMEGRTWSDNSLNYRYGFNGKEKDTGAEWGSTAYDYGFRIYNPELGRFLSVDPLTKEYPWYTPYQFAGNKPVWAVDLDGLEEYHYQRFLDENGKTVLGLIGTEDIEDKEWSWTQLRFEVKVNQRKVYVVHQDDTYWLERWGIYVKDEYTEFESYEAAANSTDEDFEGTAQDWSNVWAQSASNVASEMRGGAIPRFTMPKPVTKAPSSTRARNPMQDHHVTPESLENHPFIKKATKGGFDIQSKAYNKTPLEQFLKGNGFGVHGKHPKYTRQISDHLTGNNINSFTDAEANQYMRQMNRYILGRIRANPTTKLNALDLDLNNFKFDPNTKL